MVLLFSNIIQLNNAPIDISKELEIKLKKPISALTFGASVEIDITQMLDKKTIKSLDILLLKTVIEKKFPQGSVRAILQNNKQSIVLQHNGGMIIDNGSVRLRLYGDVPTSVDFNNLKILTDVELKQVYIFWKNSRT